MTKKQAAKKIKDTLMAEKRKAQRLRKLEVGIKALGSSRSEIAKYLKDKNIKGIRGVNETCVVANYISKLFPQDVKVDVGDTRMAVCFPDGSDIFLWISDTLRRFINDFDCGLHPDLELKRIKLL